MPDTPVTLHLGPPELAALDSYIREREPAQTREEVLSKVVATWLSARPEAGRQPVDEGMRPDQLNASNDE